MNENIAFALSALGEKIGDLKSDLSYAEMRNSKLIEENEKLKCENESLKRNYDSLYHKLNQKVEEYKSGRND